MRFGIDFGTTRTVVAAVDRGNYPVLPVTDFEGDPCGYIPSAVALDGDRLVGGWEALALDSPTLVRSFKRLLSDGDTTAETPVRLGKQERPLGEVLVTFADVVVRQLREHAGDEEIEVVLGVPANARSAQRLLTLDAFTRAGATVLGMVNEPSAAAFEYTHLHSRTLSSRRSNVIVYDLGGGTFDVTLMRIDGPEHVVETSLGISRLGGDDFDEALADLALSTAGRSDDVFGRRARQKIVDEARTAKEQLKPQSRRMILELGDDDAIVPVAEFYEEVTPLVEQTLEVMQPLIGASESLTETEIAGIYLVGGASALPLVPRMLRERFGRRVHRSPLPTASTAVGLAIAADPDSDYHLRDRLSRGIGVFRERDAGAAVSFDALVGPDAQAGSGDGITITRSYRAAHNVGWFRYVEYSALDAATDHPGDFTLLTEVLVPFDPALRELSDVELAAVPVGRCEDGPEVIETVTVDGNGIAAIRIQCPEDGFEVTATVNVGQPVKVSR
jgi:molecular chaperone HscA